MPSGGLPPISEDELTAIRLWIQQGAPDSGVIPGTETLLNSCLPKAEPPVDEPLAAPAPTDGTQFYAPPWTIAPRNAAGQNGENEVCYSTYYNLAGQIPAEDLVPCPPGVFDGPTNPTKQCFSYNHQLLRQSPNSHHSIIHIYNGTYGSNDPSWGYTCQGGTVPDGTACDPTHPGTPAPAGDGCGGGLCRSRVVSSTACLFGFGPPDYEGGVLGNGSAAAPSFSGSQQPLLRADRSGRRLLDPARRRHHHLELARLQRLRYARHQPAVAEPLVHVVIECSRSRARSTATTSSSSTSQPFDEVEYCRTILYGKGTRIADFSSHTHKRGRLFRVWGPGITTACASNAGTRTAPRPGDQRDPCIAETTPPIMVTTTYNDPAQLIFKPPLALDGDDPASRRFKFCSIYDNGYNDPATVKRNSTSSQRRPRRQVPALATPARRDDLLRQPEGRERPADLVQRERSRLRQCAGSQRRGVRRMHPHSVASAPRTRCSSSSGPTTATPPWRDSPAPACARPGRARGRRVTATTRSAPGTPTRVARATRVSPTC